MIPGARAEGAAGARNDDRSFAATMTERKSSRRSYLSSIEP